MSYNNVIPFWVYELDEFRKRLQNLGTTDGGSYMPHQELYLDVQANESIPAMIKEELLEEIVDLLWDDF